MVKAAHDAIKRGHASHAHMKCNHPVRDVHNGKQYKVKACENGKTFYFLDAFSRWHAWM